MFEERDLYQVKSTTSQIQLNRIKLKEIVQSIELGNKSCRKLKEDKKSDESEHLEILSVYSA